MCKLNQSHRAQMPPNEQSKADILLKYCNKHRPDLSLYGVQALELHRDMTRSLCMVLEILFNRTKNPDGTPSQSGLIAIDARAVPLESLRTGPGGRVELERQMAKLNEEAKQSGNIGGMMIFLTLLENKGDIPIRVVLPVEFGKHLPVAPLAGPWKEPLLAALNKGVA